MSLIQVGLLDKTGELDPGLLHSVAATLNVQVTRDLPQFWNIQATVSSLPKSKVPSGIWPVFPVKQLPLEKAVSIWTNITSRMQK